MTPLTTPPTTSLPTDSNRIPAVYASGPAPYRTLLVGSGPIAGDDDQALATALATGLAVRTAHGVDVELVDAEPLARAHDLLTDTDLGHYDAVLVVLDPVRGVEPMRESVRVLLSGLHERLTVGSALVVVIPPARSVAFTSRDLDRLTSAVRETADVLTPIVRLDELPGSTAETRSAHWADAIAEVTAAALIDPMVRFMPNDPFDEFRRVDAVTAVAHRGTDWSAAFQDVVEAARTTYGTPSAAMSLIDDETTRYFSRSGNVAEALPRGKTVCNRVMRIYGGLILGDARLDLRFAGLPEVKTGDVRFYAGYRITGPDGAPFGALCVFDSAPRDVTDEDLTALRDLALDAQRRLWALLPAAPDA